MRKKMDEKEITAIIGPRQVGKTTTLYQLIDFLISEKGIDPKRAIYFSFDYPRLNAKTSINEVLDVYATNMLREPLQGLRAPIYVFLDEVFDNPYLLFVIWLYPSGDLPDHLNSREGVVGN